jgi:rSAM/selenodomain-associated transferase 2
MISVIIPTLNAAAQLPRALAPLVAGVMHGLVKQVIVADGGSNDDTLAIAEAAGCDIVLSEPGRAKQMRAGASQARADWLMFLHADSELGPGWIEACERFIRAPGSRQRAAAFQLAFDDECAAARRVVFWARLRARLLKLPYGDQGLLLSRGFYDTLGGFADMALMEDVEFVRRIGGARLTLLQTEITTSAEKYRRDGYAKRAWRNVFLTARYLLGADPARLAQRYD